MKIAVLGPRRRAGRGLVRRLVTFHLELASPDAALPAAPRPGFRLLSRDACPFAPCPRARTHAASQERKPHTGRGAAASAASRYRCFTQTFGEAALDEPAL